jgi:Uma2 family endonuclease
LPDERHIYTYDEFCDIDSDDRYELIEGVIFAMSAPTRRHQEVVGRLHIQIGVFLKGAVAKYISRHLKLGLTLIMGIQWLSLIWWSYAIPEY